MTHAVSPGGSPPASPRGLPIVSDTLLPASVRSGSESDKQDYKAALGFEQMLVGQLVQTMTGAGASAGDDDETANPMASGPMAGQMQDALTSALMSAGGLGLAGQVYKGMQS
jgi:Rod binding domain-containing protein